MYKKACTSLGLESQTQREPLPSSLLSGILTIVIAVVSVAAVVVVMHVMVVVDHSGCRGRACGGDIALVINNMK